MYQKIMVPLDGSPLAECVLPHIEALMQGCQVNTIVFVRVIESSAPRFLGASSATSQVDYEKVIEYSKKMEEDRKSSAAEYLQGVIGGLKRDAVHLQQEVLVGDVAERLVEYAESSGIDLIVIATHGRSGMSRWVRGSIADRILRASGVPVLMVRAPGTLSGRKT